MSKLDSTAKPVQGKPAKPSPDFPLFPHATGYWAKKIRGKMHYFGPWADPDGASEKYLEQKDSLHAGRLPRPDLNALTVKDVVNGFLTMKLRLVEAGELKQRTLCGYKEACDAIMAAFGKQRLLDDIGPADFAALRNKLAKRYGVYRLTNTMQIVRSVFKYAAEETGKQVRFGPGFKRPAKKTIRLHRVKQGPNLFTADEICCLIGSAGTPLAAMILLGINCGLGNSDVGNLPQSALDLENGWLDYPRPKTGILRRCPLWPETLQAIREALAKRPEPKNPEHGGSVFITKRGGSWFKETQDGSAGKEFRRLQDTPDNPVAKEFSKIRRALGINGKRGFYGLRHSFRTIADKAKDQAACDFVMGHARGDMASIYRQEIDDERLRAVTDYVRKWLFNNL